MSLKSDYNYNEDDFIQDGGVLRELTVTITLCEYRNIIEDLTYTRSQVDSLQEQTEKLKKQNDALIKVLRSNIPEIERPLKSIVEILFREHNPENNTIAHDEPNIDNEEKTK